jgi:dihydroflavonol-4-reductase
VLEEITGIPAPKRQVPYAVALGFAHLNEAWSKLSGHPPKAPIAGVKMARYKMWFRPDRAVGELGLPQTPPREALADAITWFRRQGVARNG